MFLRPGSSTVVERLRDSIAIRERKVLLYINYIVSNTR
jgi:hypothetical protein